MHSRPPRTAGPSRLRVRRQERCGGRRDVGVGGPRRDGNPGNSLNFPGSAPPHFPSTPGGDIQKILQMAVKVQGLLGDRAPSPSPHGFRVSAIKDHQSRPWKERFQLRTAVVFSMVFLSAVAELAAPYSHPGEGARPGIQCHVSTDRSEQMGG